jgi:hypothetical protein
MICLTLEDNSTISIRPSAIRTVQAHADGFTLVTLDDTEMYSVRESREAVIAMMQPGKTTRMQLRKGAKRRGR